MANRCAGPDPTWSHLPTPIPTRTAHAAGHYYSSSAWLTPFENEALTSALRASMSPAAAASSFSSPTTPSSSSTSSASELLSAGHDAPARALAGPRGGRVTKRKPRPSRRARTTYITADPANFRRMVQEITGFPERVASAGVRAAAASDEPASAASSWPPAPSFVLPTLDTSAFLLDRAVTAPWPEGKSSSGGPSPAMAATAAVEDEHSSALQELEAIACAPGFASDLPTLESWGII